MSEVTRMSAVPLYLQIAEDIEEKANNEEYKVNTKIPTEKELSEKYHVSRITIRKALEILTDKGILVRKQRVGTFISGEKISRSLNTFSGFTQSCELNGNKPSTILLSAELAKAMPSDIKNLNLKEDDKIIRIKRLRYCNDIPVIVEEDHFPQRYAYLLADDLTGSLNNLLYEHNIMLSSGAKRIGVCYATREEAKHLGVKENDALILSRDVIYDSNSEPVFSSKEVINADQYEYKISINK